MATNPWPLKIIRWAALRGHVAHRAGLSEYQLRVARQTLVKIRLIVAEYDPWVLNHRPHFRPSNDLFRVAQIVCLLTSEAWALDRNLDDDGTRAMMDAILTEQGDALMEALRYFANSPGRRRALTFETRFATLLERVTDCDNADAA